jgi:hypothetical protein
MKEILSGSKKYEASAPRTRGLKCRQLNSRWVDWHKFDIETLSFGNVFINCPKCPAYNRGSILIMKFDNKSSYLLVEVCIKKLMLIFSF